MASAEAPGTFDIFNSNQIEPAPSAAREPAINSSTKKSSDEDIRAFAIGANRASGCPQQTRSRRRLTDEEHEAGAHGGYRHQHIVDPEVAVGRQRDTGNIRAELGEGRRGFTNQRREHVWPVAVRANGIASAQKQARSVDLHVPVPTFTGFRISWPVSTRLFSPP